MLKYYMASATSSYAGSLFDTQWESLEYVRHPDVHRLLHWCNRFHEEGLAPSYGGHSNGNLSFRVGEGNDFIITPSKKRNLNLLTAEELVRVRRVDVERKLVYATGTGNHIPSSETPVHSAIYEHLPEIKAVFHGHCEPISRHAKSLGVPETEKEVPYGTHELVETVLRVIEKYYPKRRFIEMLNHGFLALGFTMDDAGDYSLIMKNRAIAI